ncbi:MAG: CHAD domain-containing protein [bacterium]
MADWQIDPGADLRPELRRVLDVMVARCRALLDDPNPKDRARQLRDARLILKQLRGIIRMLAPRLPSERATEANAICRDLGRSLGSARDADAMRETLDKLIRKFPRRLSPDELAALLQQLNLTPDTELQLSPQQSSVLAPLPHLVGEGLGEGEGEGNHSWTLLAPGIRKIYRQGRRAWHAAQKDPTDSTLHEWRKRARDIRTLCVLLLAVWPEQFEALEATAHRLTDALGKDHDLVLFEQALSRMPAEMPTPEIRGWLDEAITKRHHKSQNSAWELGALLYGERPNAMIKRWKSWWESSRHES